MAFNRLRDKYSKKFRIGLWVLAIIFPIAFGYRTTVDAGMFMAIVSLLATLVLSQVLFKNVEIRAQGGSKDAATSDISGDEIT